FNFDFFGLFDNHHRHSRSAPPRPANTGPSAGELLWQQARAQNRAYFNAGLAAVELGNWNEAIRQFQQALIWDPSDVESRGRLQLAQAASYAQQFDSQGLSAFQLGQYERAAVFFSLALEKAPGDSALA